MSEMPLHELELVVTGGSIKCQGGLDPRPPAEELARLITERDNAVREMRMADASRESAMRVKNDYKAEIDKLKKELARVLNQLEHEQSMNLSARIRQLYGQNIVLESKLAALQNKLDSVDHNWSKSGIQRLMKDRDTAVGRADDLGGKLNDIANILER